MAKISPKSGVSAPKLEGSRWKRVVALLVMAAGIALLMFAASATVNKRQELIEVIRLKRSLVAGEVIQEEDINAYSMFKEDYDKLGTIEVDDKDRQVIIPWSQRGDVIGMYMSNYVRSGGYLTTQDITSEVAVRNPWIQAMKEDEEIYTMDFSAGTINTRLIFPGTRLRVRLVCAVPVEAVDDIRAAIAKSESSNLDLIVHPSTVATSGEIIGNTSDVGDSSLQVAEIVINNIIITDMTNSTGESIYDLYCALLKLPVNDRISYLRTELGDNDAANEWAKRTTPATITFILDKDSASRLAEFEQSGGSLKYTILPDDPEDEDQANLMSQFVELSNQINTITKGVS